jgi:hypothetical protein
MNIQMASRGKGFSNLVELKHKDIEKVETHFGYIENANQWVFRHPKTS